MGHRTDLAEPDHGAQPDVRRKGARLVYRAHSSAEQSGVLQEGLGSSFGEIISGRKRRDVISPCTSRRTRSSRSSTPASARTIWRLPRTPTIRFGSAAAAQSSGILGWIDRKMFDATGDEQKSQGWTPFILDTNGNGKRDDYVEPNQPVDPSKDKRIVAGFYGIGVNPNDGSIWGSVLSFPGAVIRVAPGDNPPSTALTEYYEVPWNEPKAAINGYGPRGMDIDRNGVVWVPLASGHLASFDRRKCQGPLNGPTATGKHCPEGWTLYPMPGPQFQTRDRFRQHAGELLHLGRSVRHFWLGKKRSLRHRQSFRFARSPGRRQIRHAARALSDGFFRQRHGRHGSTIPTVAGRAKPSGRPTPVERRTTSKAARE